MIFEILQDCCSDIVIGEAILTKHNVFHDHESSLVQIPSFKKSYELASFGIISGWQRVSGLGKARRARSGDLHKDGPRREEQRRRDIWNDQYNYGANATVLEKEMEMVRRACYNAGPGASGTTPRIPSIPSAPSRMSASPRDRRLAG